MNKNIKPIKRKSSSKRLLKTKVKPESINIDKLCQQLNYQFKDKNLLISALSHRSYGSNNNERLEFLGDSILGFVIAESLYQYYPNDNEGKLSRYRSTLVRGETLAEIAKEFDLGSHLLLGGGELKSGGYRRHSILADALEAIIGAIMLDSGIEESKRCILAWYDSRIKTVDKIVLKDPKSRLQELLQGRKLQLPHYNVLKIEGKEHEQLFTIECVVEELKIQFIAKGASRRIAEQSAAEAVIAKVTKQTK